MDWPRLIKELQSAGVTQTQIAARAGLSSSSPVSDLARGETKKPSWDLGEAVRRLHEERCGSGIRGSKKAAASAGPVAIRSDGTVVEKEERGTQKHKEDVFLRTFEDRRNRPE